MKINTNNTACTLWWVTIASHKPTEFLYIPYESSKQNKKTYWAKILKKGRDYVKETENKCLLSFSIKLENGLGPKARLAGKCSIEWPVRKYNASRRYLPCKRKVGSVLLNEVNIKTEKTNDDQTENRTLNFMVCARPEIVTNSKLLPKKAKNILW